MPANSPKLSLSLFVLLSAACTITSGAEGFLSHHPLRTAPPPAQRPESKGPGYFIDAERGDDKSDGAKGAPWRTIAHALGHLKAGDTLYLRGGTYYEQVYIALTGHKDAPITIRSFPGEQAILHGGLREFFLTPQDCWEPYAQGAEAEYRSRQKYPNLREVGGSFGDSMIGLQTYYHAIDLRSQSELVDWEDWNRQAQTDIKPLYCGPGLWYDSETGYLHLRLAHTHLPGPIPNYRGETDPRKLPLVLAPQSAIAVRIDGGKHLRFQDLVIRGGGYTTIQLEGASDIDFDNVTVWCSTYGIRAFGTDRLRFWRSALHGNVAPWTFRNDGSKRDYPGRPHRNISRLNTHALLENDAGRESSVYAFPQNDNWEFGYSEFTDAHDGLYLGAIKARFHHNLIDNMQDDGIYLSPMYLRHRLDDSVPEIHVYQNVFSRLLTALAFGGPEPVTQDVVYVYGNLFDLRGAVHAGRPSTKQAEPSLTTGKVIGDHGSPPWSAMNIYGNTFVMSGSRSAEMGTAGGVRAGHPRRVFNNIFCHLDRLPGYIIPGQGVDVVEDGNLYWGKMTDEKAAAALLSRFRSSEQFRESQKLYPAGSSSHSLVADPKFLKSDNPEMPDYRLQAGSPAVNAGVPLPEGWPNPLRELDAGQPDIGAFPLGTEPLRVGRTAPETKGAKE